ncbi:MAG: YlbF family regulator [Verrucomicrobia bacterium]|nr:YlbF family regulator [Verrucomicrobiota bacterium]
MTTETDSSVIVSKTRELCQTILEQPEFQAMRQRIDAFLADESARSLYQVVSEKGQHLNHKQQQGLPLDGGEIADFEQQRETLVNHPVARGFLDAQEQMHQIQESVSQHVAKTFELGRVPTPEDFEGGSCGTGCGCH